MTAATTVPGVAGATVTDAAERAEMRRSVAAFCAQRSPEREVRRLMATDEGFDPAVWRLLCDQLAVPALLVPESSGGAGLGWQEVALVLEETGAALLCAPVLSTVMATATLLALAPHRDADLAAVADGGLRYTVTLAEPAVSAGSRDGRWLLTGSAGHVMDGGTADRVLLLADAGGEPALFLVERDAPGAHARALSTLDQTRKLARLELAETPGERLTVGPIAGQALDLARAGCALALMAEQVGAARRVFELTLDYLRTRIQFGRPIGSFQAVKHRCADLALELAGAEAVLAAGLAAADAGDPDVVLLAHLGAATVSETFLHIAAAAIQLHGGIGFTWEHPAHLYLKRAKSSQLLLGSPALHRHALAGLLGLA